MSLNVRTDNDFLNSEDQFNKDADLRKICIIKRKETEALIDTYNARMVTSITNMIMDEFTGETFQCDISVHDKHTIMNLKLNSGYSLSTTVNSNILLLKGNRLKTDVITRLRFLIDQSNAFKDVDGAPINSLYNINNMDKELKPTIKIDLETRTKYF